MKNYIKAGFGVTIGFALAELAIELFNDFVKAVVKKNEETESDEEKSEE